MRYTVSKNLLGRTAVLMRYAIGKNPLGWTMVLMRYYTASRNPLGRTNHDAQEECYR